MDKPKMCIKLTQGKHVIIDAEDYELIRSHNWRTSKHKYVFYAVTCLYDKTTKQQTRLYMHRLLFNNPEKKINGSY